MQSIFEIVGWCHRLNEHEFKWAPGDGEGQGSLACCSPWGHEELDRTEQLNNIWGIINLSHKLQILSLISVTSIYLKNYSIQNKNHYLRIKTEYTILSGETLYNKSSLQGETKKYFESFVWFKNWYQPINLWKYL